MALKPAGLRTHQRRGSIYIVVLGTSMLVTVIGLSALMATRIERRFTETSNDFGAARLYARAAIDMGFFWINSDPDWRSNRPSGVWVVDQPIRTGTFTLSVTDPDDGDLAIAPNNFMVFVGTGVEGDTRFKLEVTVAAVDGGYEILQGTWRRVVVVD